MDTRSDDELIAAIKATIDLIKAHGYGLKVEGYDLDLHDSNGGWIATVGSIEVN